MFSNPSDLFHETIMYAASTESEASDELARSNELADMLADGRAEVIQVPLSSVPHKVCDRILAGDGQLQSHDGGTDVEMEATFFIGPDGKQLWANVHVLIKEPKSDWSTFEGRVRDRPVYTTSARIIAIISPAQGRRSFRHYGTAPFSVGAAAGDPVDHYFGVADTAHSEDFGFSGGGVTWKPATIAVRV